MAPTMEAAPADTGASVDSAPQSNDALLDSLIGDMTGSEAPAEAAADLPPGEAPTQPETVSEPQQAPPGEGPSSDYQMTEDGSGYIVPKADIDGFKAQKQYAEEVQGYFQTANDAKLARDHASTMRRMYTDFTAATPESLQNVLGFFAGNAATTPEARAQHQAAFTKMAGSLPEYLKEIPPSGNVDKFGRPFHSAEHEFADSIVNREIETAYQMAAQSGDTNDLLAAQRLDYGWTGQYRSKEQLHAKPVVNPEMQRIEQQRQQLQADQQKFADTQWKGFNEATVEGPKWNQYWSEIDRTIAPFEKHFTKEFWPEVRNVISKRVLGKLQEDKTWAADHNAALGSIRQVYSQRGQDAVKHNATAHINDFMGRARKYIPSIAKSVLENGPAKPAQAVPGKAQTPGSQTARAANGQFQPQQQQRKPAVNRDERNAQLLDEVMSLGAF